MPRYDLESVKQAAEGRWAEILSAICGVDRDTLDKRSHYPCPKCGGDDRFRALNDFDRVGAVICNQCFTEKNGDGIAAVMWLNSVDFPKALELIAKHVGVKPDKKKAASPMDKLELLPPNNIAFKIWCQKKPGVSLESLQYLGAKYMRYMNQFTVIAIPVWGAELDVNEPVGWILYRSNGETLPKYGKNGVAEWVKVKLAANSEQGVICNVDQWKNRKNYTWWKCEGSTDTLAMASQADAPDSHAFFTTANGAKEKPLDWILEALSGCKVNVCHDADEPGQHGATWSPQADGRKRAGWSPALAKKCDQVRNVQLPFPVEKTDGPDVRDYFQGGGSFASLLEIADDSEVWGKTEADKEDYAPREIDNAQQLAEANLAYYREHYSRNLVFWRNEWYRYKGTNYERIDGEHVRIRLREFIQKHFEKVWKSGGDERDAVRNVTIPLVNNVMESMKALCFLQPSTTTDSWIHDGPEDCVAFENKILSLKGLFSGTEDESEFLFDHSPDWFSLSCLPYQFDHTARCPRWIRFLEDVLEEPDAIEALQRWFGYLLLPDCSLEKMLFVIGPTRSGKGTIMKVMMSLFGESQVAAPTLNGLIGQYALHGLLGKTISIIPDARLSKRADREAITERLLSVVANDPQDIERKYLSTLTGVRMNMRFTLFSNKLPELNDSTAAMVGRGVYLLMRKSYLGCEDLGLLDSLLAELPGILNWSIMGRNSMMDDFVIRQPESSDHLVRHMRVTMAPVAQFFQERCHVDARNDELSIDSKSLFDAWTDWAKSNAYVSKMTQTEFERRAIDVAPVLKASTVKTGAHAERVFSGVSVKATNA